MLKVLHSILHRVENLDKLFGLRDGKVGREAEYAWVHSFGDWCHLRVVLVFASVGRARVEKWGIPAADEEARGC